MVRRILVAVMCVLVLAPACRKKAEPEEPEAVKPPLVQAPPGMAAVEMAGRAPVFISKEPVTAGEYCEFLRAIGRRVPEKWSAEGAELDAPVTGLTLGEAEQYATWQLARLPSASEWRSAARVVGVERYPWGEDIAADIPRADARLYLVQDYLRGSPGERAARARKDRLVQQILSAHADRILELQDELADMVEERETGWRELWRNYKLDFFTYLEDRKQAVQLQTDRDRRRDVLDILNEVAREKMKQINLKVSEATQEALDKAAEEYRAFLERHRQTVKDRRQKLEKSAEQLRQKALELRKKLEELGEALPVEGLRQARQRLEEASGTVATLEEALSARELLEEGLKIAAGAKAIFDAVRRAEARIKEQADELKARIEKLSAPDELQQNIRELQDRITAFSEHLEREFLQEKLLFEELAELLKNSARVEALREESRELESALEGVRAAGKSQEQAE